MTQKFQTSDGLTLAYRDSGSGIPVLCLAGLTRNSTDFSYLAPHLPDVRLIRLDYRGRGASDWADPATYTPIVEGQDALALLDHLGIGSAAIIGTSRGGIVAMLLAATAKDRLRGVCLVDVGPELSMAGLDVIRNYIGKPPPNLPLPELAMARAGMMHGFANVPESRWLEEAEKHFTVADGRAAINYDPGLATIFNQSSDAPPPDLWPIFDALEGLPLALVRGANSDILSAETAAAMRSRHPNIIFADVPDRGHVPFLDEPEALAVIRQWIESL